MSYTLTGAFIKLYVNNKVYKEVQSISFSVDYSEDGIYGIDSPYPQEIAGNQITVKGSVQGIRLKLSGGLQAYNLRSLFNQTAASPYISIRIQDRVSGEDIIFIEKAKVSNESHAISKGTYKLSFNFTGIIPYMALDRST